MDVLTFIANIINSLAWPIVAISIAWMMHGPIGDFLVALKSRSIEITFKKWRISFKNELTELSHCLDSSKSEDIVLAQQKINNMLKQMEEDSELYGNILKSPSREIEKF
ncbi:hypothetical protein Ga0466249_003372 [Sporomusaceae bacterium BoRhaA]|uniref:hypothetical protein n=1 Tax=Pelorhabdus rhamnosifermentans TaxID=2772457 RepID=UPI001C05F938|nr:hypothetical protein [Pelorhabdus rhamnosifermentans]MBU2702245.1 hypothetical protein [Pelorhabdus rhamnosifermentans]